MNPDFALPIITTAGWLILVGAALASYRLKWSRLVVMALVWIAIFGGLYLMVEWYLVARDAASAFV